MNPAWDHRWFKRKMLPWFICRGCGLVWLNNERTATAVRRRCPATEEDPR